MTVDDNDVVICIDVGKAEHRAHALDRQGTTVFDKALPNDERRLRSLDETVGEHGRVLVVDQPATIGA